MNTILLLGCLQAFFLIFLLVAKEKKSLADVILSVWLGHIGIHLLLYYLFGVGVIQNPMLINLNAVLPFLQGPYLYFYVLSLVNRKISFRPTQIIHLIPALIFTLYLVFILPENMSPHEISISVFDISRFFTLIIFISVPAYIILSIVQIRIHKHELEEVISTTRGLDLNWLRYILYGMSILWLMVIAYAVFPLTPFSQKAHPSSHSIFLPLTIFIYAIGYLGIRQQNIFTGLSNQGGALEDGQGAEKYSRSGLREEEAIEIASRLSEWMEESKAFLKESLSLQDLADQLSLPGYIISQVINQQFHKNFYEYVNTYRVNEFIARRSAPENQNLTILAIALDSGFSSKASFNRVFKKITGVAPSKYLS